MAFMIRKDCPGDAHPTTYVIVRAGLESKIDSNAVAYDPDPNRATPFRTCGDAARWQAVLSGGSGPLTIVEV